MKINKVAIVGGTHGNEFTGTYLLRRWENNASEITRPSFITRTLWGNPRAFHENKRYIDTDLNRSFSKVDLANENAASYEGNRAKVIDSILGPKGNSQFDLTIDMHTATSNMGVTLIVVGGDKFDLRLASYVKSNMPKHMPAVSILYIEDQGGDQTSLSSITPRMIGLEIGPIAQGLLRQDSFDQTNEAVRLVLDYIEKINLGEDLKQDEAVEVFLLRSIVEFPQDAEGNIRAMVHEELQDRDYSELRNGDPMFMTIDGKVINYEGETTYPVFINEAAYYDKKIAITLTEKTTMPLGD